MGGRDVLARAQVEHRALIPTLPDTSTLALVSIDTLIGVVLVVAAIGGLAAVAFHWKEIK
jgi:hypothetical protein